MKIWEALEIQCLEANSFGFVGIITTARAILEETIRQSSYTLAIRILEKSYNPQKIPGTKKLKGLSGAVEYISEHFPEEGFPLTDTKTAIFLRNKCEHPAKQSKTIHLPHRKAELEIGQLFHPTVEDTLWCVRAFRIACELIDPNAEHSKIFSLSDLKKVKDECNQWLSQDDVQYEESNQEDHIPLEVPSENAINEKPRFIREELSRLLFDLESLHSDEIISEEECRNLKGALTNALIDAFEDELQFPVTDAVITHFLENGCLDELTYRQERVIEQARIEIARNTEELVQLRKTKLLEKRRSRAEGKLLWMTERVINAKNRFKPPHDGHVDYISGSNWGELIDELTRIVDDIDDLVISKEEAQKLRKGIFFLIQTVTRCDLDGTRAEEMLMDDEQHLTPENIIDYIAKYTQQQEMTRIQACTEIGDHVKEAQIHLGSELELFSPMKNLEHVQSVMIKIGRRYRDGEIDSTEARRLNRQVFINIQAAIGLNLSGTNSEFLFTGTTENKFIAARYRWRMSRPKSEWSFYTAERKTKELLEDIERILKEVEDYEYNVFGRVPERVRRKRHAQYLKDVRMFLGNSLSSYDARDNRVLLVEKLKQLEEAQQSSMIDESEAINRRVQIHGYVQAAMNCDLANTQSATLSQSARVNLDVFLCRILEDIEDVTGFTQKCDEMREMLGVTTEQYDIGKRRNEKRIAKQLTRIQLDFKKGKISRREALRRGEDIFLRIQTAMHCDLSDTHSERKMKKFAEGNRTIKPKDVLHAISCDIVRRNWRESRGDA